MVPWYVDVHRPCVVCGYVAMEAGGLCGTVVCGCPRPCVVCGRVCAATINGGYVAGSHQFPSGSPTPNTRLGRSQEAHV